MNINKLVKEYYDKNEQMNLLKKESEVLKVKIKDYMVDGDMDEISVNDIMVNLNTRITRTPNEETLVSLLRSRGLGSAIETKTVPIKKEVTKAIKEGKISQSEYDLICDSKITSVLNVKKI